MCGEIQSIFFNIIFKLFCTFIIPDRAVTGLPSGAGPMITPNYMIGQPPGFQVATYVRITHTVFQVVKLV